MCDLVERIVTSADGTPICTESAGDPAKPAIVFLHGLANTGTAWDSQFADPDLLTNFNMVRYDMRGHGRSGKPVDPKAYESIRFAEDFKAVCDGYGLQRPFFAGWSLGGSIVVDIVAAYGPSCIAGVLYIGGPVLSLTKYFVLCAQPFLFELIPLFESKDPDVISRVADMFVDSCFAPGTPISYSLKLKMLGAFVAQPHSVRLNHIHRSQPYELWEQRAHTIPVLVIQGTEDRHSLYENMLRLVKELYDNVEVKMLPGVGHSPALENVKETNASIHEWVRKVSAKQASRSSRFYSEIF